MGSAQAVAQWFGNHQRKYKSVNLISMGVHAKRSHLVFEKALPSYLSLGVMAINHPGYNPEKWWRSSTGIAAVAKETIGYIYFSIFK